jgi:hypothetical protein
MAKNGTTSVILGCPPEDHDFHTPLVDGKTLHVHVTNNAVLIFHNPAEMLNLADQLKGAAEEWDAREALNAGLDYSNEPTKAMNS